MPVPPVKAFRILLLGVLVFSGTAQAAQPQVAPAFGRLVECRSIADETQRLACYDGRVAELEAAAARSDVVIVDREQIRKTQRTLFGLSLPNLGIFGGGDSDEDSFSSIETKVTSARMTGDGKWLMSLEEGGTWVQTDNRNLIVEPRKGSPIKIRKAALGSYLANIEGQVAIRVKRLN